MNHKVSSQGSAFTSHQYGIKETIREKISRIVSLVPHGQVATYGQIAGIVGCTPIQVGYAMAALSSDSAVPWQRIVNRWGKISLRKDGNIDVEQYRRLQEEGIIFDSNGVISLSAYGWHGISLD